MEENEKLFKQKYTCDYYNSNRVMLDASKAFDRVQYCKLFHKLISKKIANSDSELFAKYVYNL